MSLSSIIFVHGLQGNSETTWTHPETKVSWPKDLLAKDLQTARISTYDYSSEDIIQAIAPTGLTGLREHGMQLLKDLNYTRAKTLQVSKSLYFT